MSDEGRDPWAQWLLERRHGGDLERQKQVAAADDLSSIGEATVDVVTARSVLIYVDDKPASFQESHRVLRTGGRLSVYEPINAYPIAISRADGDTNYGYNAAPVADLAAKVEGGIARTVSRSPTCRPSRVSGRLLGGDQ